MKKFGKILLISAIITSLLVSFVSFSPAFAEEEESVQFEGDLPYRGVISGISEYGSTKIEVLTEEEAKAAEVPEGFEGSVYKMTGKQYTGITLDYTDLHISAYTVESITFRILAPTGTEELRIKAKAGDEWVVQYELTGAERKHWVDITINSEGKNIEDGKRMADLGYEDGFIHTLCICFRLPDGATDTSYVDNVTINTVESTDTVKPVLTYSGSTKIYRTSEKPLVIDGIYAYDEFEDRNITPEYEWIGESGLDENGLLKEGTYSFYITATDTNKNVSKKKMKITVGPKDTEPPEIILNSEEITACAGFVPNMIFTATDNEDKVTVETEWLTKGALDSLGTLKEGDWELKLTSSDLTGNTAEKVIKIHVTGESTTGEKADVRNENDIDFGWPGRIVFFSLLLAVAVISAAVIIMDRKERR